MNTTRVGLFGGTFDPPHVAHLALARAARDQLGLDEVRWLPAGTPWQKPRVATPAVHRIAMVALAIEGEDRFVLDDRETRRAGASYTIDTVQQIGAEHPCAQLVLIVGADQHAGLRSWHRWPELLAAVTLAVAERPGASSDADAPPHERIVLAPMPVSATDIRTRAARGLPVDTLVAPKVAAYIARHRLYRN